MTSYIENFKENKLLMEIELKPVQGDRFQPTGFPNLGAAIYETPEGKRNILLESPQSMANRFEKVCLKEEGPYINDELKGLSYILAHLNVNLKDKKIFDAETSSLVEAHRLNSPFIMKNEGFKKEFADRTGYKKGKIVDWHKSAEAVFYYDVNSLIHGVFFSNFEDGRIKFPRILSSFIEAKNVNEAESGGVKFNSFDPKGEIVVPVKDEKEKNVYSNVPYQRTEYSADQIKAYFNIDIELIKSYRLNEDATDLLLYLSLYKITKFLETGLRLRTACDLRIDGELQINSGVLLEKNSSYYLEKVQEMIERCSNDRLFAGSPKEITTDAEFKEDKKKKKNGKDADEGDNVEEMGNSEEDDNN